MTRPPLANPLTPSDGRDAGMSRRDALGTSAALVVGAALEATLAGCRADASASSTHAAPATTAPEPPAASSEPRFSPEQRAIIDAAADFLIPETSSPGALRAEVPAYVEGVVFAVLADDERTAFLGALDALDRRAREAHGRSFSSCPPEARLALVRELFTPPAASPAQGAGGAPAEAALSEPERTFRQRLRELIITGFCKSRFGATRVLQYDPIPGAYDGCRSLESVGRAWATS